MSKLSPSLFTRLYLSILLVVFACIMLTKFGVEAYYDEEEFNFFKRDVNYVFESLGYSTEFKIADNKKNIQLPFPFDRHFTAKLTNPKLKNSACNSCEYINSVNNVNYYELEEGERLAEFKLAKSEYNLIIYEMLDSERNERIISDDLFMDDEEHDEVMFFSLIIISSLFIGITIYLPMNKLQIQIRTLIASHNQFGSGNMQVKADTNIQKPLNELAHSFNVMANAIVENVKERDTFSQAIPHEVRTPLSRIQLASGLIRKKTVNEDVLTLINDIDNYVVDINDLINQIVEFSKISTGEEKQLFEHYQSIELKFFVESRLNIIANKHNKTIIIDIDNSIEVTTNPIYLRLLIDNFVKNALNHARSSVILSAKLVKGKFTFIVEDDGVGIDIADRETVFIPFARLDKSRSRKTGGLGLGLSIAKAASCRMNGKITVSESTLGGAKFCFTRGC